MKFIGILLALICLFLVPRASGSNDPGQEIQRRLIIYADSGSEEWNNLKARNPEPVEKQLQNATNVEIKYLRLHSIEWSSSVWGLPHVERSERHVEQSERPQYPNDEEVEDVIEKIRELEWVEFVEEDVICYPCT